VDYYVVITGKILIMDILGVSRFDSSVYMAPETPKYSNETGYG
jgi:hypothetical protein